MTKSVYPLTIDYIYDSTHSGAHYTLDGVHYMNAGEWAEVATKAVLGYELSKDASTPFNEGSDIEEIHASVKSSRATLVNYRLADTFEGSVKRYFEEVASSVFIYTIVLEQEVTLYTMNATEFEDFIRQFSALNERGVIRFRSTSTKMIAWLENHI